MLKNIQACVHQQVSFIDEEFCYIIEVYFYNDKLLKQVRRHIREMSVKRHTEYDLAINRTMRRFCNHHTII